MASGSVLRSTNGGITAGVMLTAAVVMLALPSGVLAFATRFDVETRDTGDSDEATLRADGGGTRLARGRSLLWDARGPEYPFTPAKNPNRPDRLVTVAVRLDPQALKAITVFGDRSDVAHATSSNLGLSQSAFNLGVARGYHNFAQEITSSSAVHRPDSPDISKFSIAPSPQGDDRDSPQLQFDDKVSAGRAPHTFAGDKDERVDLGGAVKVTRNLDLTAGVRYQQDRERLLPLTDGKRDSQAVYVGTQLHF